MFHGTSISGQDDRDEMGICLEPPEFVTGLAQVPKGIDSDQLVEFEQYQRHTVWDKPGGLANRSGAGDLDVVIYTARKWCRLALAGTPPCCLPCSSPTGRSSTATSRHRARRQCAPIRLKAGRRSLPRLSAVTTCRDDRRVRRAHQPARTGCEPRIRRDVRHARPPPRNPGFRAASVRLDAILDLDESEVDAMVDEFDRLRHKADPSE